MLGYWLTTHGRNIPMPIKRGVADAVAPPLHGARRAALRRPVAPDPHGRRDRAHAPVAARRRRSRRCSSTCSTAVTTTTRWPTRRCCRCSRRRPRSTRCRSTSVARVLRERGPAALAEAGISWERLSGWLPGGMDAEAWEAVIPSMGVMALVRNLRNFDEAGIGEAAIDAVIAKITDARRGGAGAPVPVPGVGGVQARAVGQLEAGARPHARPHGRQHPGARRHARRDRHVGLDAGAGVEPLAAAARRGRGGHGDGDGEARVATSTS